MSVRATRWSSRVVVAAILAVAISACFASVASAATFDALDIISYDTWRASDSMSEADIQAFLEAQTGVLDSLVTTDHAGVTRPASRVIHDAAKAWNLNPKVIMATLQKEQSLLAMRSPSAKRLAEAMGCGIYPGSTNRYPGFGTQVWHGARKLSTYEITYKWRPGLAKRVTAYVDGKARGISIVPKNACTYALYTYTPYYPQKLFWDVYVRYFGDPQSSPRLQPVYRLLDRRTGHYVYTSSETERYRTTTRAWNPYRDLGVAFTIDTSATANRYSLYRLQHARSGVWAYTIQQSVYEKALSRSPKVWLGRGMVGKVSTVSSATPVFRLVHKKTGAAYLTTSATMKSKLLKGASSSYRDKGVLFRLARSTPATKPVGPASAD